MDFRSLSATRHAYYFLRGACHGLLHERLHEPLHQWLGWRRFALEQIAVKLRRLRPLGSGLHFCLSEGRQQNLGGRCGSSERCRRNVPGMSSLSWQSQWRRGLSREGTRRREKCLRALLKTYGVCRIGPPRKLRRGPSWRFWAQFGLRSYCLFVSAGIGSGSGVVERFAEWCDRPVRSAGAMPWGSLVESVAG